MANPAKPSPGIEDRVRFIEHKGKRILFHDFSGFTDPAEAVAIIAQSRPIVAAQPPRSLLTLTTVRGSRFNKDVINALRELGIHNGPFVRHAAITGLSGLQNVVFRTTSLLSGRTLKPFSSMEEAKEWLVSQDD
jgi:hypothetical protein